MSKIEIIIERMTDGPATHLEKLSINETEALIEILTAFRNIARHENKDDIKIGLREGSACATLDGDFETMEEVHKSILKVVNNEPDRDNVYVNNLQLIKDQLEHRNLEMKVVYRSRDEISDIRDYFFAPFRTRRIKIKKESSFYLDFMTGKVIDSGGDNPNFHMEVQGTTHTITCTHKQASDAAKVLYGDLNVSVWGKADPEGRIKYTCADLYIEQESTFSYLKNFNEEFRKLREVDKIKLIHSNLRNLYSDRTFSKARKFIRLFICEEVEVGYLLSILLISKTFKNHDDLRDLLMKSEALLSSKLKKPVL